MFKYLDAPALCCPAFQTAPDSLANIVMYDSVDPMLAEREPVNVIIAYELTDPVEVNPDAETKGSPVIKNVPEAPVVFLFSKLM